MENIKLKKALFALIIITAFAVRSFGISETGLVAGEEFWLLRGVDIIKNIHEGNIRKSTDEFERHPGIPAAFLIGLSMKYLGHADKKEGIFFPGASFYSSSLGVMTPLGSARLPIVILGTLSCALLFWFALKTTKSFPIAAISGLILALDPFHIGLSRMAHQDIALSFFFSGAIFFYYLGEKDKKNYLKIISGVFFGFAILTKIVAILIPAIIFTWKIIKVFKRREGKVIFRKLPFDLGDIFVLIIAAVMFFGLYPKMWDNPASGLVRHLILNLGKNTAQESYFFFGENLKETNFLFYLIAIPIKMTILSLIGFFLGIYFFFKNRFKSESLFSLLIIWLVIVILVMSFAGKLKDRYITPIWVILVFFAGYGIYILFKKALPKYGFATALGAVFFLTVPSLLYFYPNHLFFFNWPTNLIYGGFNIIDSNTSICLKEAADKLNERDTEKSVMTSFGPGFEPYFKGKTISWDSRKNNSRNYPESDFVVLNLHNFKRHSPQTLYRIFKDKNPVYTIKANGLECAWIYENKKDEN